jgi:putative membrane-bound dehydrogenase-like protein
MRLIPPIPLRTGLLTGALVTLVGCGSAPEALQTPQPLPQTPVLPVTPPTEPPVTLTPAEGALRAKEIRDETSIRLAPGLQVGLWAPDSMLADPVAIDVDDHGRVYITRTNRQKHSEFDIRNHPDWMIRSIGFRTVEDRRNFLHSELSPERSDSNAWFADLNGDGSKDWRDLLVEKEQIIRLEDTNRDGIADSSRVILDDFHTEVTDVAGGILVRGDDIYLAVSPDLWKLRDTNGDGVIDTKQSISHGYGVHIGFGGHGMSGTMMGPDGRIYWQIGDLGANVVGPDGKRWEYPNQGVIVRSNPDGSDFEVYAAGMRNTHEFAFDQYGNLVSVDNDGDHPGEMERVVYVTNGQDSGWRATWQYGKYVDPDNDPYNVWMDEGMWKPRFPGQAAYFVPPVANYHSGPSGMLYEPGTALSDSWRNHFFITEFNGSPATSRLHAFQLAPKGAGFTLENDTTMLSGLLTTGIAWGPDGSMYMADWIEGWTTKNRGRIWKLDTPATVGSPIREEVRSLLASSFDGRSDAELLKLLAHADMRVREKAQFELADRSAVSTLVTAARQTGSQLERLHGIWGLGQIARRNARHGALLVPLLHDADAEVRAQAAKTLGDVRYAPAAPTLVPLLQDSSARVRFFAAEALGRIGYHPAVQPIIAMLAANNDEDVYLRSGGTTALARIGESAPLLALATSPSRALRVDAVVALRRMKDPGIARFLQDSDEYVVTEAARAINDDGSIEAAIPALAQLLDGTRFTSDALLRRAVNANLRVGTAEAARRVAAFAARAAAPEENRVDALGALAVWPKPSVLDRVDGTAHGPVTRDTALARAALAPIVAPLLNAATPPAVRVAVAEAAGRLRVTDAAPALLAALRGDAAPQVRIAALRALSAIGGPSTEEAVRTALADRDQTVRMTALGLITDLNLPEATTVQMLASVLGKGTVEEQQSAIAALGKMNSPAAQAALGTLVNQLVAGKAEPGVELEVEEAVAAGGTPAQRASVERYRNARPASNPVAAYHEALAGGNAQRGRRVVFQGNAQCTQCHSVGARGADVGPNLQGVGSRLTRETILQELIAPSQRLAPGYGTVLLTLRDGQRVAGTPREETATDLVLLVGNDTRRIPKSTIAERRNVSPMPPMGSILSRRDLRDVVEFLSTLR